MDDEGHFLTKRFISLTLAVRVLKLSHRTRFIYFLWHVPTACCLLPHLPVLCLIQHTAILASLYKNVKQDRMYRLYGGRIQNAEISVKFLNL